MALSNPAGPTIDTHITSNHSRLSILQHCSPMAVFPHKIELFLIFYAPRHICMGFYCAFRHNISYNIYAYLHKRCAMNIKKALMLEQVSRRINAIREVSDQFFVRPGWIHYMRSALGMSLKVLAQKTNKSISTVAQLEKREEGGKITLESLEKIAHAMDCQLIYAFVPKDDLKTYLEEKALEKATRILLKADVHMQLEDQKVNTKMQERIQRLAQEFLDKGDIW